MPHWTSSFFFIQKCMHLHDMFFCWSSFSDIWKSSQQNTRKNIRKKPAENRQKSRFSSRQALKLEKKIIVCINKAEWFTAESRCFKAEGYGNHSIAISYSWTILTLYMWMWIYNWIFGNMIDWHGCVHRNTLRFTGYMHICFLELRTRRFS